MKPKLSEGREGRHPQNSHIPPSASGNPTLPGALVAKSNYSGRAGVSPKEQKRIFLQAINSIRVALDDRAMNELETLETEIEMKE